MVAAICDNCGQGQAVEQACPSCQVWMVRRCEECRTALDNLCDKCYQRADSGPDSERASLPDRLYGQDQRSYLT